MLKQTSIFWRSPWFWLCVALVLGAAIIGAAVRAADARRARDAIMRADPETILAQPALARTALAIGRKAFVEHCAGCHGDGHGDQARGIPDLTDQDFLYGSGQVAEIEQIVLHGIRSGDPRGLQLAAMPAYARPRPYAAEPIPPLSPGQIADVVQFLLRKHGTQTDAAAADRGAKLYAGSGGCYDCHGSDAGGDEAIGAPNLVDDVWLYGGSPAAITRTIVGGRAGISPAFAHVLSAVEARAIAVYVAGLAQHLQERRL